MAPRPRQRWCTWPSMKLTKMARPRYGRSRSATLNMVPRPAITLLGQWAAPDPPAAARPGSYTVVLIRLRLPVGEAPAERQSAMAPMSGALAPEAHAPRRRSRPRRQRSGPPWSSPSRRRPRPSPHHGRPGPDCDSPLFAPTRNFPRAGYSGSCRLEQAGLDDALGAAGPLETVAAARIAVAGYETGDDGHGRAAVP